MNHYTFEFSHCIYIVYLTDSGQLSSGDETIWSLISMKTDGRLSSSPALLSTFVQHTQIDAAT